METLHDRLAELADDAPTGGLPAAELWARGRRVHRLNAAALAAALVMVAAVGTGIGIRLADGDGQRSRLTPATTTGVALPIEYPVAGDLPELGDTPGPLAAIWLAARVGGGAPEVVGLVAATRAFGTLPIDVSDSYLEARDAYFALSPDGRRIAYHTSTKQLLVRDLVSGETFSPALEFETRAAYTWVDATHLVGHVAAGTDVDGWVWEPGATPKLVDLRTYPGSPWLGPQAGKDPWFLIREEGDPRPCPSQQQIGEGVTRPLLCDVRGVIGSEMVLTHDDDGAVVALGIRGVEDPALRRLVATAGAPQGVTFATDLIRASLSPSGGVS